MVASVGPQVVEERMPTLVDQAHAGLVDGGNEALPVTEVVLGGRVVALAGRGAHVPQGHSLDAALGEEPLGVGDDGGAGGLPSGVRRRHDAKVSQL